MASSFPTSLDTLSDPASTDSQRSKPTGVGHAGLHKRVNDAIESVQAKVGIDGSVVTTSHDYKISTLTTATAAVTGLTTRVSALETTTNSVTGAATALTTRVSNLETTTNTATGDIAALTTKVGYFSGRNVIINGDMSIWQEGTGAFTTNSQYCADQTINYVSTATVSISRETLAVTDPFNYAAQITTTTASSSSEYQIFYIPIEDVKTLAGETVVLSFYAKATASGKYVSTELTQNFNVGGGGSAAVTGIGVTKHALTTSLARYQCTFTVPTLSGKTIATGSFLSVQFWTTAGSTYNSRTSSLGNQTATISITGVQLERGTVATPYEYIDPATQLMRCQRYCRIVTAAGAAYTITGFPLSGNAGSIYGASNIPGSIILSPPMRTLPTATMTGTWGGNLGHQSAGANIFTTNLMVPVTMNQDGSFHYYCQVSAGAYADKVIYWLASNNDTSARLKLSARLA